MKNTWIILGLFLHFTASAAPVLKYQTVIAEHVDAMMMDTVNEGDRTVEVKRIAKKPSMKCTLSKGANDPTKTVARCHVDLKVDLQFGGKCEAQCFLIYAWNKSNFSDIRGVDSLEASCFEDLSSVECD